MPVKRVTEANEVPESAATASEAIAKAILEHLPEVKMLRAQRKRGARARFPALTNRPSISVDEGERPEEIAREAAEDILQIIATDADGDAWAGDVALLGEATNFGKAKVLKTIEVEIEGDDPQPKPTVQSEVIGTMAAMRETISKMGDAVVKIANAKGLEHESIAQLVASVAKSQARVEITSGKWAFRAEKEKQETERIREQAHRDAAQTKYRWEAFETFMEEAKEPITIWSKYFTQDRKPGDPKKPPPKKPTQEEMDAVFSVADFEQHVSMEDGSTTTIRTVITEMVAEPDPKRRVAHARTLVQVLNRLPPEVQQALKLAFLSKLGQERALEIGAWLSLPLT